jgi:peptide-methionine (S)-S-oxide reductase
MSTTSPLAKTLHHRHLRALFKEIPHHVLIPQTAIVAGGCFWCTEAVFRMCEGVENVESGYIGGTVPNPTYKQVCSGDTGHAEAIRITYDASKLSYADLLDVFMATHNPTTLNRQGGDVGTQYRSAIFPSRLSSRRKPTRP